MALQSEIESAYFTLLRAREEESDLQRYRDHLVDDAQRLRRFSAESRAADHDAPSRLRRRLRHTDEPLASAISRRLEAIEDELSRMDERMEATADYVRHCEEVHEQLRRG